MDKDEDETQEAAEILTDLLASENPVSVPRGSDSNDRTTGTQVQEAQAAALQQLVSGNNVLNERSVRALLDAMSSNGDEDKKHVFWDTQVSLVKVYDRNTSRQLRLKGNAQSNLFIMRTSCRCS
eukprot:scaffold154747_cov38-Cyclotella_meneghiniana.AAC.1